MCPIKVGRKRRSQSLEHQKLSDGGGPGAMQQGLLIAFRRGLRFLVADYREQLLRHQKTKSRADAAKKGAAPWTSEDADLECRYERLPLSLVLLERVSSLSEKGKCSAISVGLFAETSPSSFRDVEARCCSFL